MKKKFIEHPTVQQHDDLKEICQPLERLAIDYFAHVRIDDKKKFAGISNNFEYHFHYIKNNYHRCDIHLAESDALGDMIVWDFVETDGASEGMRKEAIAHGASHLFTMVKKHQNFTDYFHFASSHADETINQVYVSQRDWLNQFNAYFIDKMQSDKSLAAAWNSTLSIDENQSHFVVDTNIKSHLQSKQPDLCPQRIYSTFNNRYFYLTRKEYNILYWLSLGKNAEDIAMICNVSTATVRKHIENVKNKSGCYSLFQLGQLFAQLQ